MLRNRGVRMFVGAQKLVNERYWKLLERYKTLYFSAIYIGDTIKFSVMVGHGMLTDVFDYGDEIEKIEEKIREVISINKEVAKLEKMEGVEVVAKPEVVKIYRDGRLIRVKEPQIGYEILDYMAERNIYCAVVAKNDKGVGVDFDEKLIELDEEACKMIRKLAYIGCGGNDI